MNSILKMQKLSFFRQKECILDEVNLEIEVGQITGLTGPNGGGKTSLFELILQSQSTQLKWGQRISGEIKISRDLPIAYLPQNLQPKKLLPIQVHEFIEMALWGPRPLSKSAISVKEAMQHLGLENIERQLISEISGGEWKRVALARALVQPAELYLLDEPFNHLDLKMEDRVGHLLRDLAQSKGRTFFVISHDWHAMDHYFDRLILLNKRIVADGSVRDVSQVFMNWRDPHHHEWMHL